MKQIEKVSIGGYVFTLDVDAAREADSYLKEMSAYYSNPEITDGIEERMAELLRERTPQDGVVSKASILAVIDILGRPESIAREEPDEAAPEKPARKLYRDMENAKIAGVCSGLGAYFNFDPIILRVIFTVLTCLGLFGVTDHHGYVVFSMPVIYIILWICMPAARTACQRWEMRGDDGSAESVRRSIESGANEVGSALRQVGNSPAWSTVGRILGVALGLILLVIAVSGLFAGALAVFGWHTMGIPNFLAEAVEDVAVDFPEINVLIGSLWVRILSTIVYMLPFLGMLYGSIMLIFNIKSPKWRPGLVLFVVWLISLVALAALVCACAMGAMTV